MSTKTGYIKNSGPKDAAFDDGPHIGGVIKFVCTRSSETSKNVSVTAYYYLGFGSYATSSASYTKYQVTIYAGEGTWSDSVHPSKVINSSGTNWKCTSNTATYFSAHGDDSNIDIKTKPTQKTGTIGSWTISNWTSGSKTFKFQMRDNGLQDTYTVSIAAPSYTSTITATVVSANTTMGTVTGGGTYTSGASFTITATPKAGYEFVKWTYSGGGTGGNTSASVTMSQTTSGTATASFQGKLQTITLNANGGSGGTTSVQIRTGTAAGSYPSITKPTYTGHHFLGYYDATSGGTQGYNASGNSVRQFTLTSGATGYAHGALNTGTIHFDGNGATSGSMANQTHTYGTALAFPAVGFTKTGYKFNEWQGTGASDGEIRHYPDKYNMSGSGTSTNGNTYNMIAQGTPCHVTIKFHANGGTIANGYSSVDGLGRLGSDSLVELSTDNGSTGADVTSSPSVESTYYNLGNVSTFGLKKTGYHIDTETAYALNTSGTGNLFNQQNTAAGETNPVTTKRLNGGTEITADKTITLYANWKEDTAILTYNNGGAGVVPSAVTMRYTAQTVAANAPRAFGKDFLGWKRSDNSVIIQPGDVVKAANVVPTNITLTAQGRNQIFTGGQKNSIWNTGNTLYAKYNGGGKKIISAGALVNGQGKVVFGTGIDGILSPVTSMGIINVGTPISMLLGAYDIGNNSDAANAGIRNKTDDYGGVYIDYDELDAMTEAYGGTITLNLDNYGIISIPESDHERYFPYALWSDYGVDLNLPVSAICTTSTGQNIRINVVKINNAIGLQFLLD